MKADAEVIAHADVAETAQPDEYAAVEELARARLPRRRRAVAERLSESWRTCVPVTLHAELGVDGLSDVARSQDASFFDLVVEALVRTLGEHPKFNATFDGEWVRAFSGVNLGIAVDTPRGLIAPVIGGAERLRTLGEISRVRRELTQRALKGEIRTADLTGATFTLSNLGTMGITYFTPIINPPQVAILGTGIVKRDTDGSARLLVSLTFDHRVNDGADGARFLSALQDHLTSCGSGREHCGRDDRTT